MADKWVYGSNVLEGMVAFCAPCGSIYWAGIPAIEGEYDSLLPLAEGGSLGGVNHLNFVHVLKRTFSVPPPPYGSHMTWIPPGCTDCETGG